MPVKGIISLCILLLLTACDSFKEPEFVSLNAVEVKEITLSRVSAEMNITLHNPNRHSITIENVDIDVIVKNSTIGKLTVVGPVRVLAQADSDCDFRVRMSTVEAVRAGIMSVNDAFSKSASVRLVGTIKGKYGVFKKKLKVDTTLRQKVGK